MVQQFDPNLLVPQENLPSQNLSATEQARQLIKVRVGGRNIDLGQRSQSVKNEFDRLRGNATIRRALNRGARVRQLGFSSTEEYQSVTGFKDSGSSGRGGTSTTTGTPLRFVGPTQPANFTLASASDLRPTPPRNTISNPNTRASLGALINQKTGIDTSFTKPIQNKVTRIKTGFTTGFTTIKTGFTTPANPKEIIKLSNVNVEGGLLGGTEAEKKEKVFRERFFQPEFDIEVSKLQSKIESDPNKFFKEEGLDIMSREDIQFNKKTGELNLSNKFLQPQITTAEKRAKEKFSGIQFQGDVKTNTASTISGLSKVGLGISEDFGTGLLRESKTNPLGLTISSVATKGKTIDTLPITSFKFPEESMAGKRLSSPTFNPSSTTFTKEPIKFIKESVGIEPMVIGMTTLSLLGSKKNSLGTISKDKVIGRLLVGSGKGEIGFAEVGRLSNLRYTGSSGRTLSLLPEVKKQVAIEKAILLKNKKIPGRSEVIFESTEFFGTGKNVESKLSKTFTPNELKDLGFSTKDIKRNIFSESQLFKTKVNIKPKTKYQVIEIGGQLDDIVKTKTIDFEKLAPIKKTSPDLVSETNLKFLDVKFSSGSKNKFGDVGFRFREGSQNRLVDKTLLIGRGKGSFVDTLSIKPRRKIRTKKGDFIQYDFAFGTLYERQQSRSKLLGQTDLTGTGNKILRTFKSDVINIPIKSKRFSTEDLFKELSKSPKKIKGKVVERNIGVELLEKGSKDPFINVDGDFVKGGIVTRGERGSKEIFTRSGNIVKLPENILLNNKGKLIIKGNINKNIIGKSVLDDISKVSQNKKSKNILQTLYQQEQVTPLVSFNPISQKTAIRNVRTRNVIPKVSPVSSPSNRALFSGVIGSSFAGKGIYERSSGGLFPGSIQVSSTTQLPQEIFKPSIIFKELSTSKIGLDVAIKPKTEQSPRFSFFQPTALGSGLREIQQEKLAQAQALTPVLQSKTKTIQQAIKSDISFKSRTRTGKITPNVFPRTFRIPFGLSSFLPRTKKTKTSKGFSIPIGRSPTLDAIGLNIRALSKSSGEFSGAGSLVTRPILIGRKKRGKKKKK